MYHGMGPMGTRLAADFYVPKFTLPPILAPKMHKSLKIHSLLVDTKF